MAIERKDLLEKAKRALMDSGIYDAKDIRMPYSEKVGNIWRVNISYTRTVGGVQWPTTALLAIDAETGEVTQFKEGWTWR